MVGGEPATRVRELHTDGQVGTRYAPGSIAWAASKKEFDRHGTRGDPAMRSIDPLAVAIPDPNRDGSRGHRCLAASPPEGDRGFWHS
jgi:hypothetical protein